MTLKTSEILQINATIIAGVLILLSISVGHYSNEEFVKVKWLVTIAISEIVPFSISAVIISRAEYRHLKKNIEITTKDTQWSIY